MSKLRTRLPDARITPRFAGVCTFCRFPRLEDVTTESKPVDWVIYGVPFDAGVTYRPGAKFGPRSIREASQYVKAYSIEHDVNICEVLSMADGGDAPVRPFELKGTLDAVAEHALSLSAKACEGVAAGTTPEAGRLLAVGGDHSIAYANMKATWERTGRPAGGLALIHFDSHLDTVDAVWGEKWSHASPFIRAVEEGIVNPRKMLSIGVKSPLNSANDLDYAKKHGITNVTYCTWLREGTTTIDRFLSQLGDTGVYLTFDIDCVDPAFAPGTGTPSVGGFTSAEALALVRHMAGTAGQTGTTGRRGINLQGADVVEVLPDRDVSDMTSFLAAHVIFEILCLDAVRRRPE